MSCRWTPALATTTALVVLAATGGMLPHATMGHQPERATAYLTVPSQGRAAEAPTEVISAPDNVTAGSRMDLAQGTSEEARVRLAQFSTRQDVLSRYAGDVPSYVHAAPLTSVGLDFDHPVAGPFTLSSVFGWRMNPTDVGPAVQFHIGLDYAVDCDTPVRAAADGTVVSAGDRGTGGLRVDIDHGQGLATSYRHNSRLLVSPGDRVSRGDVISMSGTTGNSTGCHLHFDSSLDGLYLDPSQLLPAVPGQPRPLSAEDLKRIRAAEHAAPRSVHTKARAEAEADAEATGASQSPDRAQRPQPRTPTRKPTSSGSATDRPAPQPSAANQPKQDKATPGTSTPGKVTPDKAKQHQPAPKPATSAPAKPKPATKKPATSKPVTSAPAKPKPGAEDSAQPRPSGPGAPVVTDPAAPAQPAASEPTGPITPVPTTPEPAQPQPTEPALPEPAEPSPSVPAEPEPSPSEPAQPVPTPSVPAEPETPEPTVPAEPSEPAEPVTPLAPEALTAAEAAQWCLPLDEDAGQKAPDFTELFTGDVTDIVGLVAALDEDALPEIVIEETLLEVSPSALWLESLPACSDEVFIEAALAARSAG